MSIARDTPAPRLPAIDRSDLDPRYHGLFDDIAITRGGMPTSFRVFLNSPGAASAISAFGKYVRFDTPLPQRLLELVIMRVAAVTADRYMWAHHTGLAADAGITPEELVALRRPGAFETSDQLTRRVVAFIDAELTHSMSDEVFGAVRDELGTAPTMDLTLATAYYAMQHALFSALRLDSDTDTRVPLAEERSHSGGTAS